MNSSASPCERNATFSCTDESFEFTQENLQLVDIKDYICTSLLPKSDNCFSLPWKKERFKKNNPNKLVGNARTGSGFWYTTTRQYFQGRALRRYVTELLAFRVHLVASLSINSRIFFPHSIYQNGSVVSGGLGGGGGGCGVRGGGECVWVGEVGGWRN